MIISEETADFGVDLWVTLNLEDKEGHRKFGVELRGGWKAVTAAHANKVLYTSMQKMLRYGPFPFPVVLFLFTMENNEGWYTWAAEPVISSGITSSLSITAKLSVARSTPRQSTRSSKPWIAGTTRFSPRLPEKPPEEADQIFRQIAF